MRRTTASFPFFQRTTDEVIQDRQARLAKIKAALKELEARKPEDESKTPEKDQINFTDSESRIMDSKTQGIIQGYNPQIAVDEDQHMIVGVKMSNSSNDQKQLMGSSNPLKKTPDEAQAKRVQKPVISVRITSSPLNRIRRMRTLRRPKKENKLKTRMTKQTFNMTRKPTPIFVPPAKLWK